MSSPQLIEVPIRHRKPYPDTPPKPKTPRGKAMTIAAGFRCQDGIILCADRQISSVGRHKYSEEKILPIDGVNWKVALTYAGEPGLAKEARDKIVIGLRAAQTLSRQEFMDVCDDVLTNRMVRQYVDLDLWLLVAYTAKKEEPELMVFDGKALFVGAGFHCFGVGDSSLIRFLEKNLYSPDISCEFGEVFAIYLVGQAKKYIDHCGGETDILTLRRDSVWDFFPHQEMWNKEIAMDSEERLRQVIEQGIKCPF